MQGPLHRLAVPVVAVSVAATASVEPVELPVAEPAAAVEPAELAERLVAETAAAVELAERVAVPVLILAERVAVPVLVLAEPAALLARCNLVVVAPHSLAGGIAVARSLAVRSAAA
jgi:hypothetical protein